MVRCRIARRCTLDKDSISTEPNQSVPQHHLPWMGLWRINCCLPKVVCAFSPSRVATALRRRLCKGDAVSPWNALIICSPEHGVQGHRFPLLGPLQVKRGRTVDLCLTMGGIFGTAHGVVLLHSKPASPLGTFVQEFNLNLPTRCSRSFYFPPPHTSGFEVAPPLLHHPVHRGALPWPPVSGAGLAPRPTGPVLGNRNQCSRE